MRDELFARGSVPMTKAEVRAVSLSKLELERSAVLWDVGAGTGPVSVEAACLLKNLGGGHVYAIEREEEGIRLIQENCDRFVPGWEGFHLVKGQAPQVLEELPAPSHVFIGGSGGRLMEILGAALAKNPQARIVVNSVTAETTALCLEAVSHFSFTWYEAVQVAVTRLNKVGRYHMQQSQNPVWVITLQKELPES